MLPTHSIEIENVPARQFVRMEAQPLVPWTPSRLVRVLLRRIVPEVPETEAMQPADSGSL